jgi:EAL domain-containing protein (putative c-di-GMP-specific phosphodiesterase class I)
MAGDFLPQAELSDAIKLIDQWVIENACAQLKKWQTSGIEPVILSVNISTQQLKDPMLSREIEDALLENQVKPNYLSIELSLDQLTFDAAVLNNLKEIKKLGVIITVKSIDSNSLDKLHTLETVDQLKLGRPIVGQVLQNEQTGKLAQQIIGEAHKKNVDVIAAGVETDEQIGFLRLNACDDVQGYLVSHPLSEKDIDAWLKSTKRRSG